MDKNISLIISGFPDGINVEFTSTEDGEFCTEATWSEPKSFEFFELENQIHEFSKDLILNNLSPKTPLQNKLTVESIKKTFDSKYNNYNLTYAVEKKATGF